MFGAIILSTRVHRTANSYAIDCQRDMARSVPPGGRKIRHWSLSADVIRKELCAERLLEPLCLSFGFERLDFVTNALVSLATRPFWLGGHWLSRGRQAAELEAELCGGRFCRISATRIVPDNNACSLRCQGE
jgi:hypothetical protein